MWPMTVVPHDEKRELTSEFLAAVRDAAIHQQKGQRWGNAQGSQAVQNPEEMGTALKSTCHT